MVTSLCEDKNIPTARSSLRSHISLMVQPAPRITNAPVANNAVYPRAVLTGACVAYEAIVIDHAEFRQPILEADKGRK